VFLNAFLLARMIILHEQLPDCYLLALAPTSTATAEAELAAHLARACGSGKPAVWVDCRLLGTLSATTAWLLWSCQQRLQRRQARLVLCGVPAAVERILHRTLAGTGSSLLMVPTLEDAAELA
jgi:anti-anti-sigma regulatory factor